jgi:hypothetical protein
MPSKRECPNCHVTLTRYQWSKLWWMSSVMSGRLVQPCDECGSRLRLSSMTLVSSAASIGLIGVAIAYLMYQNKILLFAALALLLVILVAMMATRVEILPVMEPISDLKPERVGKARG